MKPPFKIQQGYSPVLNHSLMQMMIVSVGFLIASLIVSRVAANVENKPNALSFLLMPMDGSFFIKRPWTFITHLFANITPFQAVMNLISLFFFGKMFADFIGTHRLWPVFVYSGASGAILAFLACTVYYGFKVPADVLLLGGLAPAMALLTCVIVVHPHLRVNTLLFNHIPLKYLGSIFILLGLLSAASVSWINLISYIGTIGFAVLYGVMFRKNKDMAAGFVNAVYKLERIMGKKPRMRVVHGRPLSDDEYNSQKKEVELSLDELLEKIHKKGIKSLSKREREQLDKFSQQQ